MLNRKVKIFKWDRAVDDNGKDKKNEGGSSYYERVKVGVGLFHQWGVDYEEFDNGQGNYSTAIVEIEDGTIQNVHCEMIEFIL